MEIRVKAPRDAPGVDLEDEIRQRLLCALASCRDNVERVEVRLGRAVGREVSRDGYCVIQVRLSAGRCATVVHIGGDSYRAAQRAVERASRLANEQFSAGEARKAGVAANR
jgi:hypothetical protein